jgi:hypothetical protein
VFLPILPLFRLFNTSQFNHMLTKHHSSSRSIASVVNMTVAPSRHTGAPTTMLSSTVGTYYNIRERKLTFASEWHFKPEGVRDVKERFEAELSAREIVSASVPSDTSNSPYLYCLYALRELSRQQTSNAECLVKSYTRIYVNTTDT